MIPREIKAEIIRRGLSLTDIAREADTSVPQVSMCISGINSRPYDRLREVIARKLGLPVDVVFGDDHPQPKGRNAFNKAA